MSQVLVYAGRDFGLLRALCQHALEQLQHLWQLHERRPSDCSFKVSGEGPLLEYRLMI
jgi:hypothetical protein